MRHQWFVRPSRLLVAGLLAAASASTASSSSAAGVSTETADVIGQGPQGPVVAADGATIRRNHQGISVHVTMPTPQSGDYMYPPANAFQPDGAHPGHPEAFSLWVFVFNHPEFCSVPCDADDLGDTPAKGGAFNAGGHVVGGNTLQLAGRVTTNSAPFVGSALTEPQTAEVHLAVAPHGALQPHVLPDQIKRPIGSPPFWWLAFFHAG